MALSIINYPLSHYADLLASGQPVGLSRWGDAEWLVVFGNREGAHNSNGCTFTRKLTYALRNVLLDAPDYYIGILAIAMRKSGREIEAWLGEHAPTLNLVKGDVILNAALTGRLGALLRVLRQHRIVYFGPAHCRALPSLGLLNYVAFIEPPPRDCIEQRSSLVPLILEAIHDHNATCVGFSAGLGGKAIMHDVWRATGSTVSMIDFGSTWDGFLGVPSRSYIRNGGYDWKELLRQNRI